MTTKTASKAIALFFLVFALGMAAFIVTQGISLFKDSKGYVSSNADPSVNCIKYFYEVSGISYSGDELSFNLKNLDYSEDISNITVASQLLPLALPKGTSQRIRVGSGSAMNFSIYPADCAVYKTTCFIDSGKCSSS